MPEQGSTLFRRPIDRRELLALSAKVLAGGTAAGLWLSPELAGYVHAAAQGAPKGGTVTVMNQYSPNIKPWRAYLADFSRETGIQVKLDDQVYNNQYQKITTQGQAGVTGDDVVAIDTIWTGSFGSAGFTLDLSDFLPAALQKRIAAPALASVGYKGKLFGVPAYNSSKHFFYNRKLLAAAGFNRAPATLDEMLHFCAVLKAKKGALGIQYPMSWSWKQAEGLTCDYVQMVDSLGGRFYAADNVTPVFNDAKGVQALTLMKMMLERGYAAPGSLEHDETAVQTDMMAGKTAMMTNWEGQMTTSLDPSLTAKAVLGQVVLALIPGSPGRRSGSCLGPEGWAIMKASPNQAAAKAFLNWQLGVASQKRAMTLFGQYPIYPALYADATLRKGVQASEKQDSFPVYGSQFSYAQARPNFPGYLAASDKLQVHLQKALQGSESPKQALDAAVAEMKAATGGGNNP